MIKIDMEQLAAIMRYKPTQRDAANFFKCSEDTIDRRIKEATGLTFAEFRDQNMVHSRFNLIRIALSEAESGNNVMLIFCLKNLCGWKDKPEEEDLKEEKPLINLTEDQMINLIKKARE